MAKVECGNEGPVREILLHRPEKRNALDAEMLAALQEAFLRAPLPEERVAVLRAAGSVFCAGLDMRTPGAALADSAIEPLLRAVENYPLPVVAVVQGDAIAGGNELALHCDLVVASATARFGMSLAQIGLAPSWFLTKKLLETAGPVITRQMLLVGEPLPAVRLHDLGVIAYVAPPEELQRTAQAVVDRVARNAPLSLKAMKAVLLREMTFRDGIDHSDVDRLVAEAQLSRDAKEGMAARLAKREPRFEGR
jgi:enoyl-CoA hydratase/carnithine racemase